MRIFGYKVSHILSPKRIKIFIKDKIASKSKYIPDVDPSESLDFAEMVIYRSRMCPQCTLAGKCVGHMTEEEPGCSCPTPNLYSAPKADCDLGYWPAHNGNWVEDWRKFKKDNKIKV